MIADRKINAGKRAADRTLRNVLIVFRNRNKTELGGAIELGKPGLRKLLAQSVGRAALPFRT